MAEFTPIDHTTQAILVSPPLRQPRILALLESWLASFNAVETDAIAVCGAFDIDIAVGEQLEAIARLVNAPLNSDTDRLRLLIRTQIQVIRSNGVVNDLLRILDLLFPSQMVPLTELPFANLEAGPVYSTTQELAETGEQQVNRATSAAIGFSLSWTPEIEAETFAFSSSDTVTETDPARGLANDAETTGGKLVDSV